MHGRINTMRAMRISALVMARDEERNLPRCLQSLSFADEIVVLDTESRDATARVARRYTKRVYRVPFEGFSATRNKGFERCRGDWLLSIDADEEVSSALAAEIRAATATDGGFDGFRIPRRALFLGRWLRGGGWYPDYQLRLFRRRKGRFDGRTVHERIVVDGPVETLQNDLLHHTYPELTGYLSRMNRYTTLQAEQLVADGRTPKLHRMALRPPATFLKMFLLRAGFRDGWHGFAVAALSAASTFFRFAKHWELARRPPTGSR